MSNIKMARNIKYDDSYIGKKYGRQTILGFDEKRNFICKCDCGNVRRVIPINLVTGKVVSCGCYERELKKTAFIKHGACANGEVDRLYRVYRSMISRCNHPGNDSYVNYGARGIKVCNEWLGEDGYRNFREWALKVGYNYTKDRKEQSLDRINNNKGYSPENCRWADSKTQRENQRQHKKHKNTKNWKINGVSKPAREWCSDFNITYEAVMYRIKTKEMNLMEALTTAKK